MNQLRKVVGYWAGALAILSLVIGLSGCQSPTFDEEIYQPPPPRNATNAEGTNAGVRNVAGTNTAPKGPVDPVDILRVGETILITFAGMEPPLPNHQEVIKDDGTITPPEVGPVIAAGKTAGQLQNELLAKYKKIYVHPTVTVVPAPRYYYVLGDVNHPGPQQYLSETDMIKAISAAGGLNDFAKKGDIQLTRAGSQKVIHIDYKKALQGDPKHNLRVNPSDRIFVPRSIF